MAINDWINNTEPQLCLKGLFQFPIASSGHVELPEVFVTITPREQKNIAEGEQ